MDASILAAYIAACAALTFMPGPDIAFVISESLAKGRRTGYVLSCGLCSGVLVHTFLCASGIALAIAASPPRCFPPYASRALRTCCGLRGAPFSKMCPKNPPPRISEKPDSGGAAGVFSCADF